MKNLLGGAALFALIIAGTWIASEAWKQTCLGIFEDKFQCEVTREHRRDFKVCAEQSWKRCENLREDELTPKYEACLDSVRCSCMRRLGNESCEYF